MGLNVAAVGIIVQCLVTFLTLFLETDFCELDKRTKFHESPYLIHVLTVSAPAI
jgi:hypothetical protein